MATVKENLTASGKTWEYGLQIKDKADDAVAMQVFWNNSPIKGFALMNVYEVDRSGHDSSYSILLY